MEVCPPFLLAGMGMVVSGMLFDHVSSKRYGWKVFADVPSLIILVPALLG